MSRGSVMVNFSESTEFVNVTGTTAAHPAIHGQVHRLYRAYLDRAPERDGFCYRSQRYLNGTPLADVSQFFCTSAEFTAQYVTPSNGQFVQQVYGNVLGRAPDGAGLTCWTDRLNRGTTRGQPMIGFSEGTEFITRVGVARNSPPTASKLHQPRLLQATRTSAPYCKPQTHLQVMPALQSGGQGCRSCR